MRKYSELITARFVITILALMISFAASAQPDPLDDDPGVPLDGGVSLLIAAGVGYGAKKVHEMRKKKNRDQ